MQRMGMVVWAFFLVLTGIIVTFVPEISALPQQGNVPDPYHFSTWPWKNGKVRPGIDVGKALHSRYPKLTFDYAHTEYTKGDNTEVSWHNDGKKGDLRQVRMWVSPTCEAAHRKLLELLTNRQSVVMDQTGKALGINLGDISFPRAGVFVRNNIVFYIHAGNKFREIAELLDKAVLAQPTVTTLGELRSYRPFITSFHLLIQGAPRVTVPVVYGQSTTYPLIIKATDPKGGKLEYHLETQDDFLTAGIAPDKKTYEIAIAGFSLPDTEWHKGEIILTVVNQTGMFSRMSVPIEYRAKGK